MRNTGWQRTWVRALTTALTVGMMILIFCFSMEPAERSDRTSGQISEAVVHAVYRDYDRMPVQEQHSIFNSVQHIVRKAAHFTEYTVLGLLLRLCLLSWFGRRKGIPYLAWGIGALYACTDELHQMLIDGRSGQWTDVLLDSCGVLTGVLIAMAVLALVRRKTEGGRTVP